MTVLNKVQSKVVVYDDSWYDQGDVVVVPMNYNRTRLLSNAVSETNDMHKLTHINNVDGVDVTYCSIRPYEKLSTNTFNIVFWKLRRVL